MEHLTGLRALLDRDVAPYVGFSVWAPHHMRIIRNMKLRALQFGDDGQLKPVELLGPPSYAAWARCYRLLLAGRLGFGAVALGPLVDYGENQGLPRAPPCPLFRLRVGRAPLARAGRDGGEWPPV